MYFLCKEIVASVTGKIMKIAVFYICTGKYTVFWKEFYLSSERYFLSDHEKHYFVFTDGKIDFFDIPRIHCIHQENLGWPENTLKRFHMFFSIKDYLKDYDYLFFCNANLLFVQHVDDEILPSITEGIVVTQHPGFFNKAPNEYPYDRNPGSKAFISSGIGAHYVAGGFNGGCQEAYLKLIQTLKQNVEEDERKGIVALWHDESHLNRYILDHSYKLLSSAYLYPEGWDIPFEKKILVRDKSLLGGHNYLRGNICSKNDKNKLRIFVKFMRIFRSK